MAQAGYTPISLYYSTTAAAVPVNTNLASGELAINITDGKLYYKDNTGTVKLLAGATAGPAGGSTTQVQFNSSGVLAGSANMTFNGTTLTVNDFTDSSLTSGRVTYAGASGNLVDSANLTFDGTNLTVGGSATATRFIPSGSTVATNGMYLPAADTLAFSTASTERMRISSTGAVGIGTTTLTQFGLRVSKTLTGNASSYGVRSDGVVQSDVTTQAFLYNATGSTAASAFTLSQLRYFSADQSTIGAGSAVTSQYGFIVSPSLTGATNNYGFYGDIASGTGRYNLFMNGTADNYLAGSLGLGTGPTAASKLYIAGTLPSSSAVTQVVLNDGTFPSTTTSVARSFASFPATAAASYTLTTLQHFFAGQNTLGASSAITNQFGFVADSSITGATNNYGFYGNIASGTGRWNFYAAGTAQNYFAGNVGIATTSPGSALDVKGTLRLSGSSSGYVGFAPAAAAGSTTYTLPSTDGTTGQVLSTNGSGTLSWATGGGGGGGSPGGSNTQVQYNSSGSFAGSANFTFNGTGITTGNVNVTSSTNPTAGMYYNSTATSGLSFYNTGASGGTSVIQTYYGRSSLAATTNGVNNDPRQWISFGNNSAPKITTIGSTASLYYMEGHNFLISDVPSVLRINAGDRGDNTTYNCPADNGVIFVDMGASYGGNASHGRCGVFVNHPREGLGDNQSTGFKAKNDGFPSGSRSFWALLQPSDPNGGGQPYGFYAQTDTSATANDNCAPVGLVIDNALVDNYTKINGGAQMAIWIDRRSGSTSRTAIQFSRNSQGNVVGTIQTTNSATSYNTSSDYRLKENIAPLTGAIEKVLRLKPSTYTWKVDGSAGEGFIAHELQEVIPQAVSGEKDAEKLQQVEVEHAVAEVKDEDGKIISYGKPPVFEEQMKPVYQGVDTSFLVATLTAAIQEQQALIVALTARVEALEAK